MAIFYHFFLPLPNDLDFLKYLWSAKTRENPNYLIVFERRNWVNYTNLAPNQPAPTFMTLTRHPVEVYKSRYNFCKFGTKMDSGSMGKFSACENLRGENLEIGLKNLTLSQVLELDNLNLPKSTFLQDYCGSDPTYCNSKTWQYENHSYMTNILTHWPRECALIHSKIKFHQFYASKIRNNEMLR